MKPALLFGFLLLAAVFYFKPAVNADDVVLPEVDLARWQKMDLEGKWVRYKQDVTNDLSKREGWIKFLVREKEYALLEWMAIYEIDSRDGIAAALAAANAPQWVRVAVFVVDHPDSHSLQLAQERLREVKPSPVLGWLEKHPQMISKSVAPIVEELKKNTMPDDPAAQLPPLKNEEYLAALDAPKVLHDFGAGERAEAGKTYLHQVERAIDGLVVSDLREAAWINKLIALTRHGETRIRNAAYRAFTHMPQQIPVDEFNADVNSGRPAEDRSMALLALSYSPHPMVFAKLHKIALDPRHPAWSVAISRLRELGNGFTLQHLKELNRKLLDDAGLKLLKEMETDINARVKSLDAKRLAAEVPQLFERAAWVDIGCDPLEGTLVSWTLEHVGEYRLTGEVNTVLVKIKKSYETNIPLGKDHVAPLQERVREYADELLK